MQGRAIHRSGEKKAGEKKRAGFALLAVIWGVGVISLLIVSFMSTGRLRLQAAHNIASATQAAYIAEGAFNLATISLLAQRDQATTQTQGPVYDGAPRYCVLDGAAIALAIEDESGKVDINAASQELLRAMLTGLGLDMRVAADVANMILAFRTSPNESQGLALAAAGASDKPFAPKKAQFETVMELDQVGGIDPALFRELIPFVTVHSRNGGLEPRAAPPALFAAIAGLPRQEVRFLEARPFPNNLNRNDPRFPMNFRQPSGRNAFLVHAEALLASGQTAVKEAIVDLRPASGAQYAVKEMRRGRSFYLDQLRAMIASNGAGVPDC